MLDALGLAIWERLPPPTWRTVTAWCTIATAASSVGCGGTISTGYWSQSAISPQRSKIREPDIATGSTRADELPSADGLSQGSLEPRTTIHNVKRCYAFRL